MKILNSKYTYLVIIFILLVILFSKIKGCGSNMNIYDKNIKALQDTIRTERDKNGKLQYEKYALIGDKKSLLKVSKDLSDEINKLKNNPVVIIKTQYITKYVNVYIHDTLFKDGKGITHLQLDLDTVFNKGNSSKLKTESLLKIYDGNIISLGSKILFNETNMTLITGLEEVKTKDGRMMQIFVKSEYPGFKPSVIDGALIDPSKSEIVKSFFKPKRFGVGPIIGVGVGTQFKPEIFVGIGLQYNFIRF